MNLKKILNNNINIIKNILQIILFVIILIILILSYKFIESQHEFKINNLNQSVEEKNNIIKVLNTEIEWLEYELFLSNIDLMSDDSLHKFVSNKISFCNIWYIPKNLVPISGEYIIDSRWGSIKVREETKEALDKLAKHFYNDIQTKLVIVSGYRSFNHQQWIKDRGCPDNLCAKAGYSEHQSGLAIDIYSASSEAKWKNDEKLTKYFSWFKQNAHKYGFHNTYQRGVEIDWYEIEPWHWRYLWKDFATYLYKNNMTFGEFYTKRKK